MPNTPLPAALEKLCREYNTSSGDLNAELARFKVAMQELKVKFLPRLKQLAGVVARDEADLRVAIDAAPDAFKDPRTLVCHGTKVGFMKSEGTLETDDEKRSIALLHEKFPKKADADKYINTVEKLKKDAVKKLPTADLEAIECRIEGAGDQVVIKRADGDIEKLLDKFIEEMCTAAVEAELGGKG